MEEIRQEMVGGSVDKDRGAYRATPMATSIPANGAPVLAQDNHSGCGSASNSFLCLAAVASRWFCPMADK